MSYQELIDQNATLKAVINEKNDEVAQLRHEIVRLKDQIKNLWELIRESENDLTNSTKDTITKQMYNEVLQTLELLKEKNNELECENLKLTRDNESLVAKTKENSNVLKNEKIEVITFNDDTIVLQYENDIEEAKNQILELQNLTEEITREKEELRDINELNKNKIEFLQARITELEDENFSLLRKISDADEYISRQENEKKKSSEKCQIKEQGNNLFVELIEGGKKLEDDLRLVYDNLRNEQKNSHALRARISLLQNELDKKCEEAIKFSTKREVVYTEANRGKLSALENHIKDLEKQLAEQKKVVNDLISNDDNADTLKYRLENQKLRDKMHKNVKQYNFKIRSLAEELDKSKRVVEILRNAIIELKIIACGKNLFKDTSIEKKLHEIQVNFDICLSNPEKENLPITKRKIRNVDDIKKIVKGLHNDCGTKKENC